MKEYRVKISCDVNYVAEIEVEADNTAEARIQAKAWARQHPENRPPWEGTASDYSIDEIEEIEEESYDDEEEE